MDTALSASLTIPLVSVVIPCYNHAAYLANAIESVKQQSYPNLEVLVVNDGSTDHTEQVAAGYKDVTYVYQQNQGLSAARNTGIQNSKGDFLVFLDADDWLLPDCIATNANYLTEDPELAFVSGAHVKVYVANGTIRESITEVPADHYVHLLQGNYIGMHATVMYRRRVFNDLLFDTSLRNCEDYDLYLKIARKYKVRHHKHILAAYRMHTSNMSADTPAMLNGVLKILDRQKDVLQNKKEKAAYQKGRTIWKQYYCQEMHQKLVASKTKPSKEILQTFIQHHPSYYIRYMAKTNTIRFKSRLKQIAPDAGLNLLHKLGFYSNYVPAIGQVDLGDLATTKPFSTDFGYDRGGPIDRYYIEHFLQTASESIKGRVLEIGDNAYTMQFGAAQVNQSDILHVDESNKQATFIGDISHAPHIPDSIFDCIILTQTLHLIYDVKGALATCHRILRPGGTLLLTVPGITPIDHGQWKETWYWAFTDKAISRLMREAFPEGTTEIKTYGNVYAATAFLYGMGLPEVPVQKLEQHDPHYQVIVAAKSVKSLTK